MSLLVCGGIFVEEIAGLPRRLGGSGLTAALAAAGFGAQVSLAGWVGAGEANEAFRLLDAAGVDRLGVQVLEGPTTTYRIADPSDFTMPLPEIVQGAVPTAGTPALPSSPVVLCFGTPGFDVVRARWLDRAAVGATLLFDRQGSHSRILGAAMAATIPAARRILMVNVHEALSETHQESVAECVKKLPPDGYSAAVLKAGPWGALVIEAGRDEQPFGAHNVSVCNTVGSGDVFAGALAARLRAGDELAIATPIAVAAAATWISSCDDQPGPHLADRAETVAATPAVWVDRRRLESLRFVLEADDALDPGLRERVARGLRYLGMETQHAGAGTSTLDLRGGVEEGSGFVAESLNRCIAWARESLGTTRL